MSGVNNPPSSAAAARNYEATQSLKRSVQAAFDGKIYPFLHRSLPADGGFSVHNVFSVD